VKSGAVGGGSSKGKGGHPLVPQVERKLRDVDANNRAGHGQYGLFAR
jgi:hypothetical protein